MVYPVGIALVILAIVLSSIGATSMIEHSSQAAAGDRPALQLSPLPDVSREAVNADGVVEATEIELRGGVIAAGLVDPGIGASPAAAATQDSRSDPDVTTEPSSRWRLRVRLDDGSVRMVYSEQRPAIAPGTRVHIEHGTLAPAAAGLAEQRDKIE